MWHFETKKLLNDNAYRKIINECKCSRFAGVEGTDGITVLGKLQNVC